MSLEDIHNIIKPVFDEKSIQVVIKNNTASYKYKEGTIEIKFVEDSVVPVSDDYDSGHFCRVLERKIKEKDLYETVQIISDSIQNMYKFCTVCGHKLSLPINKISTCINGECKYKIESMLTDNTVITSFNRDKETFLLLLNTAISVCNHPSRLNPYPYYFKNDKKYYRDVMDTKVNAEFFDIDKLKKIVDKISIPDLLNIIKDACSDIDVYNKMGKEVYAFLKYVIKSNRANIISTNYVEYTEHSDKSLSFIVDNNLEFYELKYHPVIESPFTKDNSIMLFHGSASYNWHPIIRMGIKNLSNTKLMSHGAAYGPGVYLASNILTARGYCGGGGSIIIGACLVKNHDKYQKTTGIYVVPKNDDILLKHLIYVKHKSKNMQTIIDKHFKGINESFGIQEEIKMSKIADKRLQRELKILDKKGFMVSYNKIELWTVKLPPLNSVKLPPLNSVKDHILQIYFPPLYPMEPPIINIISHIYKPGSHCVMDYGVILIDSIVPCEWVPNTRILSIFKNIYENILNVPKDIKTHDQYKVSREDIIKTYHELTNSLDLFNY